MATFCSSCGTQIPEGTTSCPSCHTMVPGTSAGSTSQSVYVNVPASKSNSLGVAGLVLAIIGVFLSWVPILGWIIWFLGLLFSFIGLFKSPKGTAIAGFIISLIDLIALVALAGLFAAALS